MKVLTALKLGRVSNLPTVWSNILAAAFLSGVHPSPVTFFLLITSISLMYVAGMFLNDAVDADWDRQHNLSRPIPLGEADRDEVLLIGLLLLFCGPLVLLSLEIVNPGHGFIASLSSLVLLLFIALYNWSHKRFSHSTWLMGCCRLMIYLTVALSVGQLNDVIVYCALTLLLYIVGVTYIARSEHDNTVFRLWPMLLLVAPVVYASQYIKHAPILLLFLLMLTAWVIWQLRYFLSGSLRDVPAGVAGLLSAIPLIDACFLVMVNALPQALICIFIFLTLPRLQRWIAAT